MNKIKITLIFIILMVSTPANSKNVTPVIIPPVAEDSLAIIVNKSNPIDNLSFAELRKTFLAETRAWGNGRRVTLVMREQGQPDRSSILRQIYRMSEGDFNRHFLQAAFNGLAQGPPKSLATADGVRKFIFNVPGAIGYVRSNEVDESVKVVKIDGLSPDAPGYKLKISGK